MNAFNNAPRRATRTMFIGFARLAKDGWVDFHLSIKNCRDIFNVSLPFDHPAVQAFADDDGKIDKLLDMEGGEAVFHFDDFTTNGYIEQAYITRITKVKVKP